MIALSEVSAIAAAHGAPPCGAAPVRALERDREEIERILPGARSVIVLAAAPPDKRREMMGGQLSLDLRQNFMTGNSYYCFACRAACPVGRTPDDRFPVARSRPIR